MSNLVPFGTRAWVKKTKAGKLESRAKPGYFVRFDKTSTGYRIYYPEERVVRPVREVIFNPDEVPTEIMLPGEIQSEGERKKVIQDLPPGISQRRRRRNK